jgi:aerotaxis receptor
MKINLPINENENLFGDEVEIISTTNLKGIIDTANADFMAISGFDEDEVIGKNHNVVRHPDMPPEAFADLWSTLKADKPWKGLVKNRCKSGAYYWVDAFVSPQYIEGSITGYQSVRFKPERAAVARADRLYGKIMAGKSDDDKRRSNLDEVRLQRFPIGISAKITLAMLAVLLPLIVVLGVIGNISPLILLPFLIVAVAASYGLARFTMRPLIRMAQDSKQVVDNPLAQFLYTGLHDEVGQLSYALQFAQTKLRTAIGRVSESSEVLERAATEVANGSLELSSRTEEQASSLEETAASMEQLTATVKQNADNSRQANQLVSANKELAESGGIVVSNAIQAMAEITTSSKRIADIIAVIDGIAFQTNLLALNAAVEAARAGEQGRGFAVVAGEVRTLAGRSAEAAKEIKTLISESVAKVEQGSSLVNQSGETLNEIVNGVKKVSDLMAEIASASNEQAAGIEQVNQAISQMDEITQQNAAMVEETAAASEQMVDKVQILGGLSHQFKMD